MEKKNLIIKIVLCMFLIGCTRTIISHDTKDINKYFYNDKQEILNECLINNNYLIDTSSFSVNNKTLFAIVEDFGSGEHIIEIKLFVHHSNRWIYMMKLKNVNTSKVSFKVDEVEKRLFIMSKKETELISIPFQSLLLNGDHKIYDE